MTPAAMKCTQVSTKVAGIFADF